MKLILKNTLHSEFRFVLEVFQNGLPRSFLLQILTGQKTNEIHRTSNKLITDSCFSGNLMLNTKDFSHIFPYHIVFDSELVIDHCGNALLKMFPGFIRWGETKLTDIADMVRPDIQVDFPSIVNFINGIFVFKTVSVFKDKEAPNATEKECAQLLLKGRS